MQFKVPQFIEIEDKIFGPFTFKQFVYMLGGAGLCYVLWKTLPAFLAILLIIPVGAFAGALTFYKPNGKPFVNMVQSFLNFHMNSKLYLWKKEERKKEERVEEVVDNAYIPKLTDSKLKELSWGLDVLDVTKR
jgi:hypothetical protein